MLRAARCRVDMFFDSMSETLQQLKILKHLIYNMLLLTKVVFNNYFLCKYIYIATCQPKGLAGMFL
jgi:hypothetical protein